MSRHILVSAALAVALSMTAGLGAGAKVEVRAEGFYVDGEYFFPVGVNYMPRDHAVYMWKEFDPEQMREEFRMLRSMGINTVRTFIYWEDLNPAPGELSGENIDQIGEMLDIALEAGIMVIPTNFTGHMSGGNWAPSWMQDEKSGGIFRREPFRPPMLHYPRTYRDIYEDELARENALLQARELAERYKDHPAILYWDFGNEPQYWQRPRTPELGREYVDAVVREIKRQDLNHPVALGMGKFGEDTGFHSLGEAGINGVMDLYPVHTYPAGYYPAGAKVVDKYVTYYAGFENSLSRATGLPVQFQEFGMSDMYLPGQGKRQREFRLGGYYRCSLWGSQLAGAQAGVLAWMSGDYRRGLFFREPYLSRPYELDFGIYDQRLQPKASGREMIAFAKAAEEIFNEPAGPGFDPVAILLPENYVSCPGGKDREEGRWKDTHRNHNRFLFSSWLIFRQLGINPVFVTPGGEVAGMKLAIVPALSPLSPDLLQKLEDLAAGGGMVLKAGQAPAENAPPGLRSRAGRPELDNAVDPDEETMSQLREEYAGLLEAAGVRARSRADEPFVETGILGGRYLVAINHLEREVEMEVELWQPVRIDKCFYPGEAAVSGGRSVKLGLGGFAVQVCEIGSERGAP